MKYTDNLSAFAFAFANLASSCLLLFVFCAKTSLYESSRSHHHLRLPDRDRTVWRLFGRKQKTTADYFLGDRSVPWWAVAFSIVATETSTITFISIPGVAFARGGNFGFLNWFSVTCSDASSSRCCLYLLTFAENCLPFTSFSTSVSVARSRWWPLRSSS